MKKTMRKATRSSTARAPLMPPAIALGLILITLVVDDGEVLANGLGVVVNVEDVEDGGDIVEIGDNDLLSRNGTIR